MTAGNLPPGPEDTGNAPQDGAPEEQTLSGQPAGFYAPIQPRGDPNEHRQAMAEEKELEFSQIQSERRRRNTQAAARMRERQRERERNLIQRRDELMKRMKQLEAELSAIRTQRQEHEACSAEMANEDYEAVLDQLSSELEAANTAMHLIIDEVEKLVEIVKAEANDKPYNGDPTREAAGQQAKVEQEIRRAIREKLASREAAEPVKTASLAPAYLEQLQPLEVTARPLPIAAKLKDSSKPDSTEPDPLSAVMGRLFDKEVHDDLSNALLSSLVQRSHMFLYSGDAWSEGYSVPLLKAIAAKTGTHVMAIDLPDWSVMLSHIDPLFEDLTIVSHPYMPPPDLEPSARGLDGMPFFANFTRMVTVGDEDVDIVEPEEIENDADGEEEATAQAESMMNGIRA
ncbi:hypothetical protein H4R23_003609, partial [Coemansia sp. Cherry 401B]